jgi:hypothetical protein
VIQIGNAIISDDIAEKFFVCDLSKCKGACCVEGDAGAPLSADEAAILAEIYPKVKPFLSEKGISEIEKQGTSLIDEDDDITTPTIDNKECVYAIYEAGVLKCGIEKAWKEGAVEFQKPISCHLYPIRIGQYDKFEALNYERWHICNPACKHGEALKVPIYVFLKDALTRKYGVDWYNELVDVIEGRK